ncbi:Shedu anti-phage system protein SduA domain-containing protein [Micromonospora sp. NPDC023814]|uniref:Shedu anti-phage system protein SduA domain-containing protein n=1 Tax=Micromonospora sp. NPDC023814 TaxID=3154596 RepID=UPI0033CCDD8A
MRTRSDYTLRLLIEKIMKLGASEHVRGFLQDALRHMGGRSPYRGGKELLSLLRYAEAAAREEEDLLASERIEDALAYAMNTMLRPDVEIKYQLFPGSRLNLLTLIRRTTEAFGSIVESSARTFLAENPSATAADLQRHLVGVFESASAISENEEEPGHYVLRGQRESSVWLREVLTNRLTVEERPAGADANAGRPTRTEEMSMEELAHLAQLKIRSDALQRLTAVVHNPHSTEADLQRELQGNLWIFGGTYLPDIGRRRLVTGSELDIPLLRPDGSLHLVELKKANVRIMTHQRNGLIPNGEVHRAVGQVMNYLVALDEDRPRIRDRHGVDVRRAGATVVVGHPRFQPDLDEADMNEVLRIYSSHLARIEVITYKQLLDGASHALGLCQANVSHGLQGSDAW